MIILPFRARWYIEDVARAFEIVSRSYLAQSSWKEYEQRMNKGRLLVPCLEGGKAGDAFSFEALSGQWTLVGHFTGRSLQDWFIYFPRRKVWQE